jgi:hypothetical protein|tara:strand:- start:899 stop:1228 length:330 start_codon:yes stop_codon:yes gene_type:complete
MNEDEKEYLWVDPKLACELSDTLVQTALDENLNVLTTFAALQLSVLTVSGIILTMASAASDFKGNKKTLATMSATVTEALQQVQKDTLQNTHSQFEFAAQVLTDNVVIH